MTPALSVIVPAIDEELALERLLGDLALQRGIQFELIVADGGSIDGTRRVVERLSSTLPRPARWVASKPGRGSQMNAGAALASGPELLFLHADSRLKDPGLLAAAASKMELSRLSKHSDRLAGHFRIAFDTHERTLFYHFYEVKAATGRPGTVNGDQGLWLSAAFFRELGGFDETLPFMEDARLENILRRTGEFILLPGLITTSARRFASEGKAGRQVVNALLRGFDRLGEPSFFGEAQKLYALQSRSARLNLLPYLKTAHREIWKGGAVKGLGRWYLAGTLARENFWQLPLLADCLIMRAGPASSSEGRTLLTNLLAPPFDLVTDNPVGRFISALLTFFSFYALMFALKLSG